MEAAADEAASEAQAMELEQVIMELSAAVEQQATSHGQHLTRQACLCKHRVGIYILYA